MTTWLVVGLGNPGPTYAMNRHNVGFMVVDELARRASATFAAPRGMRADVATTRYAAGTLGGLGADADKVLLVKPRTFMNDTGAAVQKLSAFHGVDPAHVVAVHDELDLDPGRLRLKVGGGDNGHNGLKSIRAHLRTGDFARVRVGVGRPPGRMEVQAFLLSDFAAGQRADLAVDVSRAADAVEVLLGSGLVEAQNRFNC
ncbi:aminoacyl-tRNA hydrolase [Auraticoccus sp. F435]|uniref:Peptidyl-tRNA hydrolase n=1 Tax=Auraticoccus cholistanensis TaxID=2656650 RepID=A0A6A9UVC9_9ACTN|nr:aminoacyl-tRNA hydrolase [Auraticoccus cholistanensis]MVA76651.1 aminoacyl-tRNA hydrolase [Auraticoccus cholistanensis]